MPRIDVDLSSFTTTRSELEQLALRQRAADAQVTQAKSALAAAVRAGASARASAALSQRVDAAQAARRALVDERAALQARMDSLANRFVRDRDPAALVGSLDGHVPIALLPMRIETRYFSAPGQPLRLRIRIYPDDLNTIDHEATPTADERLAGMAYWSARFAHDDDSAARILRDLTSNCGRGRAHWLVRILTPTNPLPAADAQAAPVFPDTDTIDSLAKATRAVLLPERWCAIGYAAGRREVFRVWGNTIPDELTLSPDWLATDNPEALLGGDRAWMVDFNAALANGMAMEVTQAQIAPPPPNVRFGAPFDLATGTLERLVVVGFEWTKNADDSAADFTDLLAAHRDSSGLGFAALGTPTNNTEAAPAGYSPSTQRELPPPPAPNAGPEDQDALQLLQWAFGIAPAALPADNIDNPHLTDQRTGLHMMNALWRGTFGDYLLQMWNPMVDGELVLGNSTLYGLRNYAMSYVRPTGPLPILRVNKQPYAMLPLVGRRFADPGDLKVETAIGKILNVLRPMWELARAQVPLLTDGNVDKAKDILQTAAWSQTAFYRDKDNKAVCMIPNAFSDAQWLSRNNLVQNLIATQGPFHYYDVHIGYCNDFLPDPPYSAGYLAGVPWVLANDKDPTKEAPDSTLFGTGNNYIAAIANAAVAAPDAANRVLQANQAGPALLQALLTYSVQLEKGDAADRFLAGSGALQKALSRAPSMMPYVEAVPENEAMFTVQTPKELQNLRVPAITGRATLGEHVANTLAAQWQPEGKSVAWAAAKGLYAGLDHVFVQARDLGGVKRSLVFLSGRSVGELNIAFRATLDTFSYRLDAWITARANRRLEQMRETRPTGLYVGGYAWVENLKADTRPASEGFLLAPSQAQAATAAVLRSGFMANHEQGAFDIALDSTRTRRAEDILQGLTRDQPLAALYGYRIERGLRDNGLGKYIWPLRLAYPWRPIGGALPGDATEAIGARDVVDGVAVNADWESDQGKVYGKLAASLSSMQPPANPVSVDDKTLFALVMADAQDLADSVSDLLMAEGALQVVQGNPARAAAAMAIADKQSLPIETQVGRTPRGGASYTQRIAVICPDAVAGWPADRRALAEPALNAWIASMLGDPARYRFGAWVHRPDGHGGDKVDVNPVFATWDDLTLSPLSAVLLATGVAAPRLAGQAETGFRNAVAAALLANAPNSATVSGLDIDADAHNVGSLGLAAFEAIAVTLKTLIDKSRFATRKDLVRIDEQLEATLPDLGEYAGVDVDEIVQRADSLVAMFKTSSAALLASADADALLAALANATDVLPQANWPAQVFAIDAPGADPAQREKRGDDARDALKAILDGLQAALDAPPPLLDNQLAANDAQRAQHAIERLKRLFGKDFPVLPRFAIGPYAAEFNASLGDQDALTVSDPWRINGWLSQVARVRDGADRFAAAVSAHEALSQPFALGDLKVVQFPHAGGSTWAALPEAWQKDAGAVFDPKQVPEELHAYLAALPGTPYHDINRVAPDVTIALHAPGIDALTAEGTLAAFVCDEWPELIPDPFQGAAIAFHYDAPGARPPQTILLALPPQLGQAAWSFDDAVDVIHEAFDLSQLRAVRPRDLGGGLGGVLPGNFLPHSYTDDLPSVRVLEMMREARKRLETFAGHATAKFTLGKI